MGGFLGGLLTGAVVVVLVAGMVSLSQPVLVRPSVSAQAPQAGPAQPGADDAKPAPPVGDADLVELAPRAPDEPATFDGQGPALGADVTETAGLPQVAAGGTTLERPAADAAAPAPSGSDTTVSRPAPAPAPSTPGTESAVAADTTAPPPPPVPQVVPEEEAPILPVGSGDAPVSAAPEAEEDLALAPDAPNPTKAPGAGGETMPDPEPDPVPDPEPDAVSEAPVPADDPQPVNEIPEAEPEAVADAAPDVEQQPAPTPAPEEPDAAAEAEAEPDADSAPEQPAVTDRRIAALPQIGGEAAPDSGPAIGTRVVPLTDRDSNSAPAAAPVTRPIEDFAAPFENPQGKPLMSIVLIDDAASTGGEALENFPYPLTFGLDPTEPGAEEKMARYRAAGFEVVALVNLPRVASARDAEISFAVWLETLPESVAILEGVGTGIQGNRDLSDQVTAIAKGTGRGLVTRDSGLNTVQKLAARSGVPSAVVFRDFDGAGQSERVMRRFLDQAAFRAGQEGSVIMLGRVRPETISALLLWGLQDRADRVALAPLSAVLRQPPGGS